MYFGKIMTADQKPALEWLWMCFIKLSKYLPVFTISNLYFWDQGFMFSN